MLTSSTKPPLLPSKTHKNVKIWMPVPAVISVTIPITVIVIVSYYQHHQRNNPDVSAALIKIGYLNING